MSQSFASMSSRSAAGRLALGPLALVLLAALVPSAPAQEQLTEHTYRAPSEGAAPSASLADVAWLAGHWVGEGLGGVAEEAWSPPRAGAMMGMFRLIRDDTTSFYELLTLVEENGSLVLRLKHFNADLTGWEEKGETVDFPLVSVTDEAAHFSGLSFYRRGADSLIIYLAMRTRDGPVREETFRFARPR